MKKMSVMISLLVCALIWVFAVEPCFSAAVKEDFAGYRYRTKDLIRANRYNKVFSPAATMWTVRKRGGKSSLITHLLTVNWYNWDTKVRREAFVEYTYVDKTGYTICVPSEDPPPGPARMCLLKELHAYLYGTGIIFGPFSLIPESPDAKGEYGKGSGNKNSNRMAVGT